MAETTGIANDATELRIRVEGTIWSPGRLWELALEHLAGRFARVRPLDLDSIPAANDAQSLAEAVEALQAWASGDVAWQRELVRFFDEHISLHVRPDPSLSRDLRALGRRRHLVAVSALPEGAARAVLQHAGLVRAFAQVQGEASSSAGTSPTPIEDPQALRAAAADASAS